MAIETVEAAVIARCLSQAAVTTISPRVWQMKLPPKPVLPAGRVQLIGEAEFYTHDGTSNIFRARLQVDAVAEEISGQDPYAKAVQLARAYNGALSGFRGDVNGFAITGIMRADRRAGYDADELKQVVVSQDYICWYRV